MILEHYAIIPVLSQHLVTCDDSAVGPYEREKLLSALARFVPFLIGASLLMLLITCSVFNFISNLELFDAYQLIESVCACACVCVCLNYFDEEVLKVAVSLLM